MFSNATPVLSDLFDLFGKVNDEMNRKKRERGTRLIVFVCFVFKVDQNSSVNKMTASNISGVFGPSFLREVEASSSLANGIGEMEKRQVVSF